MHLEIVTPDQKVFAGEVVSAQFPGSAGSFQVLDNHAPLISTLDKGRIVLRMANQAERVITVDGGVVEVSHNQVIVLAEAVGMP
ncbi:MAG: ATP synthase F1 subunit epsilon [Ferruginibacter sp.]|nr:ATP synthase F1 subunit epsilon [Cytophagales bacterium]